MYCPCMLMLVVVLSSITASVRTGLLMVNGETGRGKRMIHGGLTRGLLRRLKFDGKGNPVVDYVFHKKYGSILHELAHGVGMGHEHQRMDSKSAIQVHPSKHKDGAYIPITAHIVHYLPYDFYSISHYNGDYANLYYENFSIDTIDERFSCVYNKDKLSVLDIYKLNMLFKCKNRSPHYEIPQPPPGSCGFPEDCTCILKVKPPSQIEVQIDPGAAGASSVCSNRCKTELLRAHKHLMHIRKNVRENSA